MTLLLAGRRKNVRRFVEALTRKVSKGGVRVNAGVGSDKPTAPARDATWGRCCRPPPCGEQRRCENIRSKPAIRCQSPAVDADAPDLLPLQKSAFQAAKLGISGKDQLVAGIQRLID